MPFLRHDSFYKDNLGNHANTMGIVGYQNWSILNGIRFYASSGNINHGKFDLYVPQDFGTFIGYSYVIDWEEYQ